jgi:hypothetical protein
MRIISILLTVLLLASCTLNKAVKEERISLNLKSTRITVGTVEANMDKFFEPGAIRKENIKVYYFPESDIACIQFKVGYITVYQFWSQKNRYEFIESLKKYKEDYESRNIINNFRKTRAMYSRVLGYCVWQNTQLMEPGGRYSYPDIDLGYCFKEKLPFFTITQRDAFNESRETKGTHPKSPVIMIYFTRAEADALAQLFAQDYLDNLDKIPPPPTSMDQLDWDLE